ncbi:MAG: M50 family metallopeptidase [Acidobacteriota bacterium]
MTSRDRARMMLVISVVATVVVYAVGPLRTLAYPLLLLSTLAHEMGHGLAAMLTGARFERLVVNFDGSGVAYWSAVPSRLRLGFVAAGGLVGPAFAAAFGFLLGRRPKTARRTLGVVSVLLALSLILVVRGVAGWVFVGVLAVLLGLLARSASDEFAQLVLVFLSVQLALSVFSRGDYLFTDTARTAGGPMPSDVAHMAQALFLPYWFWGFVCGAVSVFVLLLGVRAYWR